MKYLLLIIIAVTCFKHSSAVEINIDSIYATRYTKTLDDSVFVTGDVIRAPEIRFSLSSYRLTAESDSTLRIFASFYTRNPFLITEIQMHTDTRGNAESNKALSLRRAQAVVTYLVEHYGCELIFSERMIPVGKGETEPLVSESFIQSHRDDLSTVELLHQLNRRFEIRITGFLGQNFYENQRKASHTFDARNTRNSAYYEDLIRIADHALLEGNYARALEFYSYAADLAPANEGYAAEQRDKIRALISE